MVASWRRLRLFDGWSLMMHAPAPLCSIVRAFLIEEQKIVKRVLKSAAATKA